MDTPIFEVAWTMRATFHPRMSALDKSRHVSEERTTHTRVVTTDSIAGSRIVSMLGFVTGLAIRSRGLGGNIMAGLDALGDDSALSELRDELARVRQEARERMEAAASQLGANAVVGVRFDTAEVGHDMIEIVAYGTAVLVELDGE